ncbi:DUF2259 domain-containing protein [Treponema phagedenis]|uniref:DUF2259 domain-containing protein n=1 Tax=Treponema phagedenis TaxID=162 RepID=A0A0B7GSA4_TREPH|nr:DUF2259 domain-containing protein [Treponema phagedenis]EFW37134.1 hypothetical protein HMPREF9554_02386 [Treponema phagedenis F0421]NVP25349.1 DUF2259 domain-containing protein [Treponema phagedenis]NVP25634.1 DUF2259 domain-containing protein [Treponema phagedenis]QEJ95434.1 DUF2259 domain-containing protein [Treponema phagedenis]QEJ97826.1 DUF2259 domain-containing protein [Treponema phagedenis]
MRKTNIFICLLLYSVNLFAGDVATFVNLGFSADGSKYAFGQYGLTDQTYQAYSDICIVDVESNSFIKNGIFKTSPTKETRDKDSKSVFLALQNRAQATLIKNNISESRLGRVLYSQAEDKTGTQTLYFRDFQTENEYTVMIHVDKTTKQEASFYITVDIVLPNGSKISKKTGRPGYVRPGTKTYALKKILINDKNNALIFIVEKHEYSSKGLSIRYMVETIHLPV